MDPSPVIPVPHSGSGPGGPNMIPSGQGPQDGTSKPNNMSSNQNQQGAVGGPGPGHGGQQPQHGQMSQSQQQQGHGQQHQSDPNQNLKQSGQNHNQHQSGGQGPGQSQQQGGGQGGGGGGQGQGNNNNNNNNNAQQQQQQQAQGQIPGQTQHPADEKQPSRSSKPMLEVETGTGITWKVGKKLGSGSFGDVFLATTDHPDVPREVAIKCESLKAPHPQLAYEARLLGILKGNKGFSNVYFSGVQRAPNGERYNVLVMDLLSHSLEDLVVMCHGRFSLKSTLLLADQLLSRMEDVHAAGFVHRDIKPENFLLGRAEARNTVHVIDFGLSKRYWIDKTQEHIPYKDNKSLTGTARYASINAHRGVEQSRRDDLEAIGHMLLYFLRGNLPWQGLPAKTKDEKYRRIKEKKIETSIDTLCAGFPEEISLYMQYVRSLRFQDRPDYAYLRGLFQERYNSECYDRENITYDWSHKIEREYLQQQAAAQHQAGGSSAQHQHGSSGAHQNQNMGLSGNPNNNNSNNIPGGVGGGPSGGQNQGPNMGQNNNNNNMGQNPMSMNNNGPSGQGGQGGPNHNNQGVQGNMNQQNNNMNMNNQGQNNMQKNNMGGGPGQSGPQSGNQMQNQQNNNQTGGSNNQTNQGQGPGSGNNNMGNNNNLQNQGSGVNLNNNNGQNNNMQQSNSNSGPGQINNNNNGQNNGSGGGPDGQNNNMNNINNQNIGQQNQQNQQKDDDNLPQPQEKKNGIKKLFAALCGKA